jgi:hypothetical protein
LRAIDRYPEEPFSGIDNLIAQILLSAVRKALIKAGAAPAHQPRNLPFASLGDLFKGRERALEELRVAFEGVKGVAVAGRALDGSAGLARRGLLSNTPGRARPSIRRCCSSALTTRRH